MRIKKIQYYIINGLFLASAAYLMLLLSSWLLGHSVSPKRIMNSLIVTAYTLCMVGFNWPDSKKLNKLRIIGLSYSAVLLIVSLLSFNEIISFKDSWNFVIGGMAISFMLTSLFQLYRVKTEKGTWQYLLKSICMILSVLVFGILFYIFESKTGSNVLFDAAFWTIILYSVIMITFYLTVVIRSENIRSQLKAAQEGR